MSTQINDEIIASLWETVATEHPDWEEDEIGAEVAKRFNNLPEA